MRSSNSIPSQECAEGIAAARCFDKEVRFLLSVPHETIAERERAYKGRAARNPHRRGPKPKVKPSASGRVSRARD